MMHLEVAQHLLPKSIIGLDLHINTLGVHTCKGGSASPCNAQHALGRRQ